MEIEEMEIEEMKIDIEETEGNENRQYRPERENNKKNNDNYRNINDTIRITQTPEDLENKNLIDELDSEDDKSKLNSELLKKLEQIKSVRKETLILHFQLVKKINKTLPLLLGDTEIYDSFDEKINNMKSRLDIVKSDLTNKTSVFKEKDVVKSNLSNLNDLKEKTSYETFTADINNIGKNIKESIKIENIKYISFILLLPGYILFSNKFNFIKFIITNLIIILCILYTLFKINSFNTDNEIINNLFIILYPFLVFIISILKYIDILKYITDFPGNIIVFSIILTLITISNLIYLYNTKHFPYIQFCIYIILTILYILDFLINKRIYT